MKAIIGVPPQYKIIINDKNGFFAGIAFDTDRKISKKNIKLLSAKLQESFTEWEEACARD